MTPQQAMHSPLLNMDEGELKWVWAYCEMKCRESGTNADAMKRYEDRMKDAIAELERRK